jgi:hypothetical protein
MGCALTDSSFDSTWLMGSPVSESVPVQPAPQRRADEIIVLADPREAYRAKRQIVRTAHSRQGYSNQLAPKTSENKLSPRSKRIHKTLGPSDRAPFYVQPEETVLSRITLNEFLKNTKIDNRK